MAQSDATFTDGEGLYLSDRWRLTRWPTNLDERRTLHDRIITFGSITSGSLDAYFDRLHTVTPYSDGPCISDLCAAIAFDLGQQRAEAVASSNLPEVARLNAAERDFRECSLTQFSDEVWLIDPYTSLPTKLLWIRAQRMAAILRGLDQSPSTAGVTSAVEVTASMNSASPEPPVPIEPNAIFRREDDVWALRFNRQPAYITHYKGLAYISELLRRPYVPIEAAELAGPRLPSGGPVKMRSAVKAASIFTEPGLKMASPKIIKNMHSALDEMKAELAGLPHGDLLSNQHREDLKKKILQVERYLREVKNNRGRARKVAGPAQRARSSVTKAISEAIEKISKKLPALAEHLQNSIDTGSTLMYAPIKDPDWSF